MISNTDPKGATVFAPKVVLAGDRPSALHLDLAHHLPGRLRLRSALLKGNARASEEAQRHLAEISGVRSASANPLIGSILLKYDPEVIPPINLVDMLATHGYIIGASKPGTEAGTEWAEKLATAVKDWVINALAERLALAVISALA
jgi:Heavy metal associated domain 2